MAVLDVGCWTGALLRPFVERLPAGVELAGIEPSPALTPAPVDWRRVFDLGPFPLIQAVIAGRHR